MFLSVLTNIDVDYLHQYPQTIGIYRAGVMYRSEGMGIESWKSIPILLQDGFGDCEDLACWLAAQYRVRGIGAIPFWTKKQYGRMTIYHIRVRLPDGTIEDPSKKLGM